MLQAAALPATQTWSNEETLSFPVWPSGKWGIPIWDLRLFLYLVRILLWFFVCLFSKEKRNIEHLNISVVVTQRWVGLWKVMFYQPLPTQSQKLSAVLVLTGFFWRPILSGFGAQLTRAQRPVSRGTCARGQPWNQGCFQLDFFSFYPILVLLKKENVQAFVRKGIKQLGISHFLSF